MNNLVANLPFLFKQNDTEASYAGIREKGQNVSQWTTKCLNLFKRMAKYLAETTEFDIIKHKEIILPPTKKNPKYFYYQLATLTTKKNFTWTLLYWEFLSKKNYIIMSLPGWFISKCTM